MGDGQQKTLVTRVSDPITRVSWDNYVTVSMQMLKNTNCLMKLLLMVD
jgi:hypothetical protein